LKGHKLGAVSKKKLLLLSDVGLFTLKCFLMAIPGKDMLLSKKTDSISADISI
jgi:hypothetical protein